MKAPVNNNRKQWKIYDGEMLKIVKQIKLLIYTPF